MFSSLKADMILCSRLQILDLPPTSFPVQALAKHQILQMEDIWKPLTETFHFNTSIKSQSYRACQPVTVLASNVPLRSHARGEIMWKMHWVFLKLTEMGLWESTDLIRNTLFEFRLGLMDRHFKIYHFSQSKQGSRWGVPGCRMTRLCVVFVYEVNSRPPQFTKTNFFLFFLVIYVTVLLHLRTFS